ncbi:MAG: peptide chain release factor 2 [Deltaproteobacteria bacterium CG03_land_8_20_14_0_80_45_14]|nr:MAG: peptide chain release factor 2 [Deltaproteobacteria bacterium CG03_land_8_20_14_0_80_45_14]
MLIELKDRLKELRGRLESLRGIFDTEAKGKRLDEIGKMMAKPDFWEGGEAAQKILKERTSLLESLSPWQEEQKALEEMEILLQLVEEQGDEKEAQELLERVRRSEEAIDQIEFRRMLGGERDPSNAIVSINAGAGGTEAQDWVGMLLRMYLRWAEKKKFETKIIDILMGEEAGLKNVTFMVNGCYAYGYLKAESGIHRLVRISPFDAGARRHTSFASVFVIPEVSDDIVVAIDEKDLRVDTFRSSGAGGQHVNKTDSAVRITHLPTGIVVQCQNERSQHKNKATALKILRARLYEKEMKEKGEKLQELHNSKKEIAWGSQIRSYIMHPYKMVKDHRSNKVIHQVDRVMDGEIDELIRAYLLMAA